jgi:hypothetical protein
MSDAVNFHFIYTQQPPHTINNHIRKQQPASKLINTYLSTAAQYLNRTKSFHVPSNTIVVNNKNSHQQSLLTTNPNLARSVPSNMNNLKSSSVIPNLPVTVKTYHNDRYQPISSEINLNKTNKSTGIVNTLRQSLRKNKERFYNKRSTTMKSCHTLSNYEQSTNTQPQTSMTPTLHSRHQYIENNTGSCTAITMKYDSSTSFINNSNDDELEEDDGMCKRSILDFKKIRKNL